jgi:hypothetical protein
MASLLVLSGKWLGTKVTTSGVKSRYFDTQEEAEAWENE